MALRQLFFEGSQVPRLFRLVDHTESVFRQSELADLKFGVCDNTTRNAGVGRPVQISVKDVLAP